MTWNDVALKLVELLLPVVAALIIALATYAIAYLRKLTDRVTHDIARKALYDALNEAEVVARDAIRATNQTLVDNLKAKAADGKLTKEEAREAMNAAKDYFMGHITQGSMEVLEAALGPVTDWLEGYIEAKLATEKSVQDVVAGMANPL